MCQLPRCEATRTEAEGAGTEGARRHKDAGASVALMRTLVVLGTTALSPTVRGLSVACTDGAPLSYMPGQWVNLHVEVDGEVHKRAYSIACAPDRVRPERFEIAVTRVPTGRVSSALHELPVGATLTMDGPHGLFTRQAAAQEPALLVGTGTGVCPLRAMLQQELQANEGPAVTLLFGARTQDEILYRAEFEALSLRQPRFSLQVTLSRADATWAGRRGYVQTHVAELVDQARRPHVYVCGLAEMVFDVRRVLKEELGFDRKQIHTERYD